MTNWFDSEIWAALRAAVLREEPMCAVCFRDRGEEVPSAEVAHFVAPEGNPTRFWNRVNLEAVCSVCYWAKASARRVNRADRYE